MGASSSASAINDDAESFSKPGLGDLPESCAALILSHLDPPQICRLAKLNRTFRSASSADVLWELKLPSNYEFLVNKLLGSQGSCLNDVVLNNKKQIYALLSRPNSFDGGTKVAWVEKNSGGICFAISWKGMKITGIDDRRYWNHIPTDESRFHTIAYLKQMWWFEVEGELEFQFPPGIYSVYFRLQLGKATKRNGRRICDHEQVHGWDIKPVKFRLSASNGQHAISQCYLSGPGNWVNYHVGDFIIENGKILTKIKFSMTQIDCTHTKGGLSMDSVLIFANGSEEVPKQC
ncbi:Phloem protein 2-like [Dillenia turbinata]|uniref:Phloem protein 2-like n=1 Tax=Dillenia turbinata TaxID=194707 RepID=A0AAN8VV92_9MAGN